MATTQHLTPVIVKMKMFGRGRHFMATIQNLTSAVGKMKKFEKR